VLSFLALQRKLGRFFYRKGLSPAWFAFKVMMALLGTTVFWLGAWNLGQYDCVLTPTVKDCVYNSSAPPPPPGSLQSGHRNRGGGSLNESLGAKTPGWLKDTVELRGEVRACTRARARVCVCVCVCVCACVRT
jgi:hypothetical protein